MAKSAMLMIGKVCKNSCFSFLNFLVFQEGFYIVTNLKLFVVKNTHLNLLVCFNLCFFILRSSERFDSHVILPSFLSSSAIAPLIICFDLKFKNMFSKIKTSHSYNCISVFIILLQIFFQFNFLSAFCNLI